MQSSLSNPRPRLAVLTLEGLAAAAAVRRFLAAMPETVALLALSDPFRPQPGGTVGHIVRLLRQSGPRLMPYLAANFVVPRLAGAVTRRPAADVAVERCPLRYLAPRLGIPVIERAEMNAPSFHQALREHRIDALLTFHCDQILSAETLAVPRLGGLNVHVGLLPEQRGPTPTIHALLGPEPHFGLTLHRLTPQIDLGGILRRETISLPAGTTALAAASLLHLHAVDWLATLLPAFFAGIADEQPMARARYRSFPSALELRSLATRGRSTVDLADFGHAFRCPV
jgi:folate-dependent phosphoribosylglycinamide formyltransferase PurN